MVTFTASLIGAAAVFARVTSAVPQGYGNPGYSAPAAAPSNMMDSAAPPSNMMMGSAAPPSNMMMSSAAPPMMMSSAAPPMMMSSATPPMMMSSAAPPSHTMSSATPPSNMMGSESSSHGSSYGSGSYGSGSSSWNNGGYDNCVQQCVAQFGSPSSMNMNMPPSSTSGGSGGGMTHTVIVAPTQGVLRYIPFAVNASVGDTVKFLWGANNHTVTKSSALNLCNKTGDQPFASGEQNKSFVFTQVVNDTNPTFFYCGTPTHCQKGMFGIINPPNALNQNTSVSMMLPSLASMYPSTQAAMSYTMNVTASQPNAASWGMGIDMSAMPSWAQSYTVENVMYTQSFLAMNADALSPSGSVDLTNLAKHPVMLPVDVAASLASTSNSTSSYGSPASSSTASGAASPSTSAVGGSSKSTSGAGALSTPRVAVALIAVAAVFVAL